MWVSKHRWRELEHRIEDLERGLEQRPKKYELDYHTTIEIPTAATRAGYRTKSVPVVDIVHAILDKLNIKLQVTPARAAQIELVETAPKATE